MLGMRLVKKTAKKPETQTIWERSGSGSAVEAEIEDVLALEELTVEMKLVSLASSTGRKSPLLPTRE